MQAMNDIECKHPEDNRVWSSECCGAGYVDDLSGGSPDGSRLGFCAKCRDGAVFTLVCSDCMGDVQP
jgi:hypothetical protein